MKIRISITNMNTSVLALLIFSSAALWTITTATLYIAITIVCALYCFVIVVYKKAILPVLLDSHYLWWFTGILIYFSVDAIFRIKAGIYNFDFQFFTWVSMILVMIILIACDDENNMLDVVCNACSIAAIAICCYIFVSDVGQAHELSYRIGSNLSGNVITVAMHLGYCSIGVLYNYMYGKKTRDLVLFLFVSFVMLLTGSKLVFFTLLCEMAMYIFSGYGSKKARRAILSIGVAMLLLVFVVSNERLYAVIGARTIDFLAEMGILKGIKANYSGSTIIRRSLLHTAFSCFLEAPIFGSGYGAVASRPPYFVYAHCNYLEILACYGILGFVMFYSMHFYLIRKLKRHVRNTKEIYFCLLTFLLNGVSYDITQITYSAGWMNYFGLTVIASYLITPNHRKRFYDADE